MKQVFKHKYKIIEIGNERSIMQDLETFKLYIIDNNYMMLLDEMGLIK